MNPQEQLDPSVIALTKAIGKQESGGDYNKIGDNGHSKGAYQWNNPAPLRDGEIPANFRSFAQSVGENPDDFSPTNQDRVAYKTVESWGKQGLNPAQIASKWNSGNPNAYKEGHSGYNAEQGVNYDVPSYVNNVAKYYDQYNQSTVTQAPSSSQKENTPSFSSDEGIIDEIKRRKQEIENIKKQRKQGLIGLGSSLLQQGGEIAGEAGSLATRALSAITPNFIERPIAGALKGATEQITKMPLVKKGVEKYQEFSQKHPEAAANLSAVGNIASLIPVTTALGETFNLEKNIAKGAIEKGLKTVGIKTAEKIAPEVQMVMPKMSAKAVSKAVGEGRAEKTGILGKISIKPNKKDIRIGKAISGMVDPSKTITENVGLVKRALTSEAETLKNDVAIQNHPYTFKKLQSRINKIEKPVLISSDNTLNKAYDTVRKAAVDIAKKEGGTISGLLEARKKFDAFVERQFPNLYSSDKLTPMKSAIRDIRREMNDFIGESLPEGNKFKESLAKQADLYEAIDRMSANAQSEVGTNALQRFSARNPIISGIAKKGIGTLAGGELLKGAGILP